MVVAEAWLAAKRDRDMTTADTKSKELVFMASGVSVVKAMEVFYEIDKDGSGTLDADEIKHRFKGAVQSQGLAPMFGDVDKIVVQLMQLGEGQTFKFVDFLLLMYGFENQKEAGEERRIADLKAAEATLRVARKKLREAKTMKEVVVCETEIEQAQKKVKELRAESGSPRGGL